MLITDILNNLEPYKDKLKKMPFSEIMAIIKALGWDFFTEWVGLPEKREEGQQVITRGVFLERRNICQSCFMLTENGSCDIGKTIEHVSLKAEDGTPLRVPGCGCTLRAAQKTFTYHCPAGKW